MGQHHRYGVESCDLLLFAKPMLAGTAKKGWNHMLLVVGQDRGIQERLSVELAEVESHFAAELLSDLPCVNDLVTHVERYRGKMLRPMLVLVSGLATGPAAQMLRSNGNGHGHGHGHGNGSSHAFDALRPDALNHAHRIIATVVEMVHMATLVHDDILDEAEVRRQGTTVNALNGNEAAVMLGDYMISHAYHLCSSIDQPAISRMIADATNTVCEGELLQLANRNNWLLDEGTYFEIIRRKTASLTGGCCKLGAVLHDEADATIGQLLYQYGEKVGTAFQVVDDLLDLVGEEKTVGKSLGRDLVKGKLTLPLIHYLSTAPASQKQPMLAMIQSISSELTATTATARTIAQVRSAITSSDAIDYARQTAQRLIDEAKTALEVLPESPARTLLGDMADAVLTRKS